MGTLDDAIRRRNDTELDRTANQRAGQALHAARLAEGHELAQEFLARVRSSGIRPDKTVYDVTYVQFWRKEDPLVVAGWSFPKETGRRAAFEVYHIGGDSPEFWLSTNGRVVVVEKTEGVEGRGGMLYRRRRTHTARCREFEMSIAAEVVSSNGYDSVSIKVADAMAAYLAERTSG